jgi:hypothetical protein
VAQRDSALVKKSKKAQARLGHRTDPWPGDGAYKVEFDQDCRTALKDVLPIDAVIDRLQRMASDYKYNATTENAKPSAGDVEKSIKLLEKASIAVLDLYKEVETKERNGNKKSESALLNMQRLLSFQTGTDEEARQRLDSACQKMQRDTCLETNKQLRDLGFADSVADNPAVPYYAMADRISTNISQIAADVAYLLRCVDPAIATLRKGHKPGWAKRHLMARLIECFRDMQLPISKHKEAPILDVYVRLVEASTAEALTWQTAYGYLEEMLKTPS